MERKEFEKMSDQQLNSMRRWNDWGQLSLIFLGVAGLLIFVLGVGASIGEENRVNLESQLATSVKIVDFYHEITATVLTDRATLAAFAKAAPSTLSVNERGAIEHRCIVQSAHDVESLYSVDIALFSSSTSDGDPIVGLAQVHPESVNDCVDAVGKK